MARACGRCGLSYRFLAIPGMAHDQAANAAAVQDWGVGIAVAGEATPLKIRAAVERILETAAYGTAARAIASQLDGIDGAMNAALELEVTLRCPGETPR